ncbi:uncharacterized protein PAE49_021356 isoform 1-T2 [Odontesthes bonariensis]|uniref:uncharacterized protein LOC142368394 n=1 Tax=Odontesthes bonariensis TaxID=219752 RepID=UPI003F586CBC
MDVTVVFFLGLVGFASSQLPYIRKCDPVQGQDTPTLCSNYKNIEFLLEKTKELNETMGLLSKMIYLLKNDSEFSAIVISRLRNNLTDALAELTTTTKNHQRDISELKSKLMQHKEIVTGNFSEIEKRLDLTENQLKVKKAKLENLQTETKAAFNDTKRLLSLYNAELSLLKMTAQDVGFKVEAQLNVTRRGFEDELNKIQKNSQAFSASLEKQKADAGKLKDDTDRRLEDVQGQLKAQNLTVNHLVSETKGLAKRLGNMSEERGQAEVTIKVAFSASIVASSRTFTGPRTAGTPSVLIFDKVFTNIGKAYNKITGIFTAPVKGVYQFTFMTFGHTSSYSSGARLLKNGCTQVSTWESSGPDPSDTTSNTVILELNVNDDVNIVLWQGGKIYTSVFSGFLIFPLM